MSVVSFSEGDLSTAVLLVLVSLVIRLIYPVLVTYTRILRVRMWNRQTRSAGGTSAAELELVRHTARADVRKDARVPKLLIRRHPEK